MTTQQQQASTADTRTKDSFLAEAHDRVLAALAQAPTHSGHFVEDGQWKQVPIGQTSYWTRDSYDHGNWTSGFWVGCLYYLDSMGVHVDEEIISAVAGATAARAVDETTHDLGFMFWPSAVLLSAQREEEGKQEASARWAHVALQAAETLARRFRANGSYLQAFGALDDPRGQPTSTIDTMMNLPLLWWAANRFQRNDLYQIALSHATTTAHDFIREDGATYHIVHHGADGQVEKSGTFQGASNDSCWTRGQAWSIHGFIDAYLATEEQQFEEAILRCLDYWIAAAPLNQLAPYDLRENTGLYDASASAILASGLSNAVTNRKLAASLEADARLGQVLDTLATEAVFAGTAGIIGKSTYSAPHGWGIDGALPYGDFFYLRALANSPEHQTFSRSERKETTNR